MKTSSIVLGVGVLAFVLAVSVEGKTLKDKEDCEVCYEVLSRFEKEYDSYRSKPQKEIEDTFKKFCKNLKDKEERFCYYIGGLETSATYILGVMSKPFKSFLPTIKLCQKLYDIDSQICELKKDKLIDVGEVNFKKIKVKDLKKILSQWGEEKACKGCTEKSDYVRAVKELLPKYNAAAAEKLRQRDEL